MLNKKLNERFIEQSFNEKIKGIDEKLTILLRTKSIIFELLKTN